MRREKLYELNKVLDPYYEFELVENSYVAIFATGDFEGTFDYDRGLLQMTVLFDNRYREDTEYVVGYVTNIDDGVWQMFRDTTLAQQEARELCELIKKTFGTRLPNEAILNGLLSEYGIFGMFTG